MVIINSNGNRPPAGAARRAPRGRGKEVARGERNQRSGGARKSSLYTLLVTPASPLFGSPGRTAEVPTPRRVLPITASPSIFLLRLPIRSSYELGIVVTRPRASRMCPWAITEARCGSVGPQEVLEKLQDSQFGCPGPVIRGPGQ